MFKGLFYLSASAALLILVSGIIAAGVTGSDKAFEAKPLIAGVRSFYGWVKKATGDSNHNDNQDFVAVANGASQKVRSRLSNVGKHPDLARRVPGSDAVNPPTSVSESDPRISICKVGSVEPQALKEIPLNVATAIKARYDKGEHFSMLDIQGLLGQPVCNQKESVKRTWRYLVEGSRIIDVEQFNQADAAVIRFTNF